MTQIPTKMGFIYFITSQSGKTYIGQTIQPIEKRFQAHQSPDSNCVAIYNAIKKYGWENMKTRWYECPDEELDDYEELMVLAYGTLAPGGYNLKEGGGSRGKLSEESRRKIGDAQKGEKNHNYGKTTSDETKQKMREANSGEKCYMYGKHHTEESRKKMSESHTGKTLSDDHKQKLSVSQQGEKNHMYGKMHTEESKRKMSVSNSGEKNVTSKKVYQYDLDGNFIQSFGSGREAARHINKINGNASISACARGKPSYDTAYGFKWTREKL